MAEKESLESILADLLDHPSVVIYQLIPLCHIGGSQNTD